MFNQEHRVGVALGSRRVFAYGILFALAVLLVGSRVLVAAPQNINFEASLLQGEQNVAPTTLQFGPDGRLYIADIFGFIYVYTIERSAEGVYSVVATETISSIRDLPNHDDDGTLNPEITDRQITGILVAGTAVSPILYVTSSDPRIGGGFEGETGLDTNSGIVSRLTQTTAGSWANPQRLDLVRGLPRSEENHAINGMALTPDGQTLFVTVGGNTNMGAPSTPFAKLPEYALAAAILSVDLAAIGETTYDVPTLDDPTRGGAGQPSENDPFGGNDGLNQGRWQVGSPVQVYASGFRNPYDVVLTENGRLFSIDNGPNAGWGGPPQNEGPAGNCTNDIVEQGESQFDALHYIDGAGYYGGHPNPARGNPQGIFGSQANAPVDFALANPIECDHRAVGNDGSLVSWPNSTNGIVEYTASAFNGAMQGDLLAAGWNSFNIYRVKVNFNGGVPSVDTSTTLFSSVSGNPLDITAQGDDDIFPGTIWVASLYDGGPIHVFEPVDLGNCTGVNDPALDEDGDGYDNADEIASGTSPCNSADRPADNDQDLTSDVTDSDDDNDGVIDLLDLFPIDADNGATNTIPAAYTWDNDGSGLGGLLGLGFTGLMSAQDRDYLELFDPTQMTAGGAGGLMTIDSVPSGTAVGAVNNQEYAFQAGVSTATSLPFTAHAELVTPFINHTPQGDQAVGMFIGTGDQDNFIQWVVVADGLRLIQEVAGTVTNDVVFDVNALGQQAVSLYLTVDPATQMVQPSYAFNHGERQFVGDPVPLPELWQATGEVLAVGVIATAAGGDSFTATWDQIEIFFERPATTGSWEALFPSNEATGRQETSFVELDGKFYLIGGRGNKPVNIYDPALNRWSEGANPPLELHHFQAFAYEEQVVVLGGYTGVCCASESGVSHIYYYDPAVDAWSQGDEIPLARRRGSAGSVVYDGKFYMVGGLNAGHGETAVSYAWFDEYDPATGHWSQLPDAPRVRDHFHAAVVGDKLYLLGGRDSSDFTIFAKTIAEVDVYDFQTGKWTTLPAASNLPTPRGGSTTAVLGREILVIGGESQAQDAAHAETEAFDTVTQTWRTLAPLNQGRHGAQTAVCNETLYIAGGSDVRGAGADLVALERFAFGQPQPCEGADKTFTGYNINAGGPALVTSGVAWEADQFFVSGFTAFNDIPVENTEDDVLYQTDRNNIFGYAIPVPPGCYELKLHFAEILWPFAWRIFNVAVEGEIVLENYEIPHMVEGDNPHTFAVVETFEVNVPDGELNIDFTSVRDNGKVSAIQVIPKLFCGDVYQTFMPLVRH